MPTDQIHTDAEVLALLALGEFTGTEDERRHAQTCAVCAGEVSELQQLVTLGRSEKITLAVPSREVWARIQDELGFDLSVKPGAHLSMVPASSSAAQSEDGLTAHAQLRPVAAPWSHASGVAELATDERGRRVLQVTLHAELPTSGVRQAWLIHRDDPTLRQTLGILDGSHGLWTVEHSIDLEKYAILDISQQGIGESEHSGQTIVRGEFALIS